MPNHNRILALVELNLLASEVNLNSPLCLEEISDNHLKLKEQVCSVDKRHLVLEEQHRAWVLKVEHLDKLLSLQLVAYLVDNKINSSLLADYLDNSSNNLASEVCLVDNKLKYKRQLADCLVNNNSNNLPVEEDYSGLLSQVVDFLEVKLRHPQPEVEVYLELEAKLNKILE